MNRQISAQKLWETLPEGTKAEEGDQVIIDFVGEKMVFHLTADPVKTILWSLEAIRSFLDLKNSLSDQQPAKKLKWMSPSQKTILNHLLQVSL